MSAKPVKSLVSHFEKAWTELDVNEEKNNRKIPPPKDPKNTNTSIADGLLRALPSKKYSSAKLKPKPGEKIVEEPPKMIAGPTYQGPRIPDPPTLDSIIEMISWFREGKTLHYRYAHRIINLAKQMISNEPTVKDVNVPKNGRLTIVGDLHGQLSDLLTIFKMNGYPAEFNQYLFNGDFVDRTPNGCEIILILFSFKLLYPNFVFLNRGNHEMRHINNVYGFEDEMTKKYDAELFEDVQECFCLLPLVTIIEKTVIVIHGGLSEIEQVSLDDIRSLDGANYVASEVQGVGREDCTIDTLIMEDLLWSDPKEEDGFDPSRRGTGMFWGPDVSTRFLEKNKLKFIVRSHEMVPEGYQEHHSGKVITIFSASNYAGLGSNLGAFMVFKPGNWKPTYHTFNAGKLDPQRLQAETLQKLREKIYQYRHELLLLFTKMDLQKNGLLTVDEWAVALTTVLNLNCPWKDLQPYLVDIDFRKKLNYCIFLERYQVHIANSLTRRQSTSEWQEGAIEIICRRLTEDSLDLNTAFKNWDKDANGKLDYVELVEAITSYNITELDDSQIYSLMKSLDKKNENHVSLVDFSNSFGPWYKKALAEKEAAGWFKLHTEKISDLIQQKGVATFSSVFHKKADGRITFKEFSELIKSLNGSYTEQELQNLANYSDAQGASNKTVGWREFRRTFLVIDPEANDWQEEVLAKMCSVLFTTKAELSVGFKAMDLDGDGLIGLNEFNTVVKALNDLLDFPLSDLLIEKLHRSIDKDGDGLISYDEFLLSFRVEDTQTS